MDFVSGFDGPAWMTLIISLGALGVSVWSIVRTRPAAPSWEFEKTTEEVVDKIRTQSGQSWVAGSMLQWHAVFRQLGPGDAESVKTQVRTPHGTWSAVLDEQFAVVGRGGWIKVILCNETKVTGQYIVRLTYRHLPNTRKPRTWECRVTLV